MDNSLLKDYLDKLYTQIKAIKEGEVADYIPELAKVDADNFAIALVTTDGHVYQIGDSQVKFTIQSISKAFTYGIALEDNGLDKVLEKVDVEPSGEAFNSISLEENTGRPKNPMINAGAIATTGLVKGKTTDEKIARILDAFSLYTGHSMEVDHSVYLSEKESGHRNRSIAHLLRNYNILENDPDESLNAYFQQCSIEVTCRDLALMGASLANNGINPISAVRTVSEEYISNILSVMTSSGMYDYSGNWIYNIGMPAKSGVGGGIVAVLPGQFGLAIYSPRLDKKGNSVRGIKVCEALSKKFGLHMLHSASINSSMVIRSMYTGAEIRSSHAYNTTISDWLDVAGKKILVLELMGELTFVAAELIISEISKKISSTSHLIIDFSRVSNVEKSASLFFTDLIAYYKVHAINMFYVGLDNKYYFTSAIKKKVSPDELGSTISINDLDSALEWCENNLIVNSDICGEINLTIPFNEQQLCAGMSEEEITYLKEFSTTVELKKGETVCLEGDEAKCIYFLESGKVSIWLRGNHNTKTRLGVLSSGSAFGEAALFAKQLRSADVIADTNVVLRELQTSKLLVRKDPLALETQNKLFFNLSVMYDKRLRRANLQIKTLSNKL